MRQIVLDTETTGLDPLLGHRIIEIGCIEIRNRRKTDQQFHHFLNPERDIEAGAFNVHGIRAEDLASKPLFRDIAQALIAFVRDSELIIHNAPFDVAFIDNELRRLGSEWGSLSDYCKVIDTLTLARDMHPGQKNSLDALCLRYRVDNSKRDLHGALLDANLLAEVYLAMTGGQTSLLLGEQGGPMVESGAGTQRSVQRSGSLRLVMPSKSELAAHERRLDEIQKLSGGRCLWRRQEPA